MYKPTVIVPRAFADPRSLASLRPRLATIQGVALPFDLDDFCTPHWPRVLDYYGTWRDRVEKRHEDSPPGPTAWAPQGYALAFCKALEEAGYVEQLGDRFYKSADEIMARALAHFGAMTFMEMVTRAGG